MPTPRPAQGVRMTPASVAPQKTPPPKPPSKPKGGQGFMGKKAISMVVYGPPGVGKTSFADYFPDPYFMIDPKERGIEDLIEFNQCPRPKGIEVSYSHEDAVLFMEKVASGKIDCQTLVIDSLTGFELFCFQSHARANFGGDMTAEGFFSFQKGPKAAAKAEWATQFLGGVQDCVDANYNVILIAHSKVKNYKNPTGSDYERAQPYLDDEVWQQTHRAVKAVVYYDVHVDVTKAKGESRKKANPDSERRLIYTDHSTTYIAKNRWGLPPIINADGGAEDAYRQFAAAFQAAGT